MTGTTAEEAGLGHARGLRGGTLVIIETTLSRAEATETMIFKNICEKQVLCLAESKPKVLKILKNLLVQKTQTKKLSIFDRLNLIMTGMSMTSLADFSTTQGLLATI